MNTIIVNNKTFLTVFILIQIILELFVFTALNKYEYNWVEYSSVNLALLYSFIVYVVLILNSRNKSMMLYYCIATMMISVFLISDICFFKYTGFSYRYIYIIVLFIMQDITLHILSQNINKRLFYRYIAVALWTVGVLLIFLNKNIYMLIYQVTFLFICIYPIIFFIYNFKKIKSYGRHLIPILLFIIFLNVIFLVLQSITDAGKNNYDLYVYLNLIELFLSYLVLSALGLWQLIKSKKYGINRNVFIGGVFIIGYLYCYKENFIISFFTVFNFVVIFTQCQLLDYYVRLVGGKNNYTGINRETSDLLKIMVERNMIDFEREELYKEQVADFLHDEILQDAIYIKREIRDRYEISTYDKIFNIADKMINKTRGQINLYKPYINYDISLGENYYNLIKSLKNRFNIDNILVDFVCDSKLFLSPPYDLVIYRMIHELVTNIFKHSKGEYSVVELEVQNKVIILNVTNYGDYLENGHIETSDSRGLKIIKRETDRFDGTIDIISSVNSDVLINKDTCDNCTVNIKIKIPVKGDITYEHFINR